MNHYFDINGYCLRCGQHAYKTTPTCLYDPLKATGVRLSNEVSGERLACRELAQDYLKREYEKTYND